ncbi:MAG: hypothetical protein ACE5E6_06155 [Phycisphaerae bacterium]
MNLDIGGFLTSTSFVSAIAGVIGAVLSAIVLGFLRPLLFGTP